MAFASGKWALAICDNCGWSCKYSELKPFVLNQVDTGLKMCGKCWSPDHPQLQVGKNNRTPEAIALYKPRPDTGKQASTSFYGWNPVCSLTMRFTLNRVTVVTS